MEAAVMVLATLAVMAALYVLASKGTPSGSSTTGTTGTTGTTAAPAPGQPAPAVPLSRGNILELIRSKAIRHNVDPDLMTAIVEKESSYNPAAINPTDPSYGLGQIQTFWLKYFGYVEDHRLLLDPDTNLEVMARILKYFRSRVNPKTGQLFRFPEDVDVYNVGETKWAKGIRNTSYRDHVTQIFNRIKGAR